MEYINFEAEDENASDNEELAFSDNEGEDFIDDSNQEGNQYPSFYRFMNQARDPAEAVQVWQLSKVCRKVLKNLCSFQDDLEDSFFNAILFGLLFHLSKDNKVCKDKTEEILGKEFFEKFKEKKEMLQLDHSLENFFKKYQVASDFLEMRGLFLRAYERRDKFWSVIKKRCTR